MIYRTVTVTPTLTDGVDTEASIKGNAVSVTAETGRDISVDADLTSSIIAVTADVSANIKADAELTTAVSFGDYDVYSGAYQVTPLAEEDITLATNRKIMTDDVTVFKVPYFETSNEHGTTVYIAEV